MPLSETPEASILAKAVYGMVHPTPFNARKDLPPTSLVFGFVAWNTAPHWLVLIDR